MPSALLTAHSGASHIYIILAGNRARFPLSDKMAAHGHGGHGHGGAEPHMATTSKEAAELAKQAMQKRDVPAARSHYERVVALEGAGGDAGTVAR